MMLIDFYRFKNHKIYGYTQNTSITALHKIQIADSHRIQGEIFR